MTWSYLAVSVVGVVAAVDDLALGAIALLVVEGGVGGLLAIIWRSSRGRFGMSRSLPPMAHAYFPYPSMLLGAQLHIILLLNLTSMLQLAPWYVIVVFQVI